jgi:hypothetical protein
MPHPIPHPLTLPITDVPTPHLRAAIVAAIDFGPPPTIAITNFSGTTPVAGVRFLGQYTPRVGDMVWILQNDNDLLCLGSTGLGMGWHLIAQDNSTASSSVINIPPGVFTHLRITLRGQLTDFGTVRLRMNGYNGTTHLTGIKGWNSSGSVVDAIYTSTGNAWYVARWSSVTANNALIHIYNVDGAGSTKSYFSVSHRMSNSGSAHQNYIAHGRVSATGVGVVSALELYAISDSGSLIPFGGSGLLWYIEGFVGRSDFNITEAE